MLASQNNFRIVHHSGGESRIGLRRSFKSWFQSYTAHEVSITLFLSQWIEYRIHLQAHHARLVIAKCLFQGLQRTLLIV